MLVGFVMADDASGDCPDLAVSGHVTRDAPDDSALDTSLRLGGERCEQDTEDGSTKDQRLHGVSPKEPVAVTILNTAVGSVLSWRPSACAQRQSRTGMRRTGSQAGLPG